MSKNNKHIGIMLTLGILMLFPDAPKFHHRKLNLKQTLTRIQIPILHTQTDSI